MTELSSTILWGAPSCTPVTPVETPPPQEQPVPEPPPPYTVPNYSSALPDTPVESSLNESSEHLPKKENNASNNFSYLVALLCLPIIASRQQYAFSAGTVAFTILGAKSGWESVQRLKKEENDAAWWKTAESIIYLVVAGTLWAQVSKQKAFVDSAMNLMGQSTFQQLYPESRYLSLPQPSITSI